MCTGSVTSDERVVNAGSTYQYGVFDRSGRRAPVLKHNGTGQSVEGLSALTALVLSMRRRDAERRFTNADAPRFVDVAAERSATEYSLRVFFRTPHATMPNFVLNQDDIEDIISYILSMKPKR